MEEPPKKEETDSSRFVVPRRKPSGIQRGISGLTNCNPQEGEQINWIWDRSPGLAVLLARDVFGELVGVGS